MSTSATDVVRLRRTVERLSAAVRALRRERQQRLDAVVPRALQRRGLTLKGVLHDGCLVPRSPAGCAAYYRLLQHYSFRLFLRDVIQHRERFVLGDLVRYCSPQTARRYLEWLRGQRLVVRRGRAHRLAADVVSFGPTLEWLVAAILEREYGIPSAWNVRLDGAHGGGDYDVVGVQDGVCIYVETKSSPPRNVDAKQVRAFLARVETLQPEIAVFLNDTQLRMADKIAPLFAAALRRRRGAAGRARLERLHGEIFGAGRLYIANSDPALAANLGACLAHYFRRRSVRA